MTKESITNKYTVSRINNIEAQDIALASHYMHRRTNAVISYGLFQEVQCIGICIWGHPPRQFMENICGVEEAEHVIELKRFWIADITPKNTESFFMSQAIKQLPDQYNILVSYADTKANHLGVIYQAASWMYIGPTKKATTYGIKNSRGIIENVHSRGISARFGTFDNARDKLGDKLIRVRASKKYRYLRLRGSKKRRKQLLNKLQLEIYPYPKEL
jgi:hypothetical protein